MYFEKEALGEVGKWPFMLENKKLDGHFPT